MEDPKNVDVRCADCDISFVTSEESYHDNTATCPVCGYGNLRDKMPWDQ